MEASYSHQHKHGILECYNEIPYIVPHTIFIVFEGIRMFSSALDEKQFMDQDSLQFHVLSCMVRWKERGEGKNTLM